jgi:molecular chaperone GrpE
MPKKKKSQDPKSDPQSEPQVDTRDIRIAQLEEELAQTIEAAKRTMADFQNFKRRTEEERAEIRVHANIHLLESIFPAIDNLARAFENIPAELTENEWIKGIQAIEANLLAALQQLGLQAIDKTDVAADPNLHQVLMEAEGPAGQVTQILEKGYTFNGKTIRAAKVTVGKS